jgi:hypothetical protein
VVDQNVGYVLVARGDRTGDAPTVKMMDEMLEQVEVGRMADVE